MATNPATLLPPNASALERAAEQSASRIHAVPIPLAMLWDPATCTPELLPWLAWALSVDTWDPTWSIEAKRAAVAASIDLHRKKGTPAAIDAILASFDELLELVEWHQTTPPGVPHTFDVILPLVTGPGPAPGGARSRAAFAETIIREVSRVKPLREHFRLVQKITVAGAMGLAAAAQFTRFDRLQGEAAHDTSPLWATYLQTEDGEPIQDEAGGYLEDVG